MQYRKRANEIVAHLMAKDDERTAVYRQYEQGSILLEQVEEYEHQYQVAVQKQEAAFKKVMLAVNDIEKAFSHGNPWLMKFRAISIPEKLERTHLKEKSAAETVIGSFATKGNMGKWFSIAAINGQPESSLNATAAITENIR